MIETVQANFARFLGSLMAPLGRRAIREMPMRTLYGFWKQARRGSRMERHEALDRSSVRAKRTWKWLDEMLEAGFSKAELARRLGYKKPKIQFDRIKVTARNEKRVEKLYRHTMRVDPLAPLTRRGRKARASA